jgi:hypothetical protein
MTTKADTSNGLNKQNLKYRLGIEDCVRQLKNVRKEIRRNRAKTERLRIASRRTMNDTWKVLRRVEATL